MTEPKAKERCQKFARITIEAYGQTEVMEIWKTGEGPFHHRERGVPDQARQDGENILRTMDRMREQAEVDNASSSNHQHAS